MTPTPTPQQIIELAREAGIEVHERKEQARIGMDALLGIDSTPKLQRFATLLLERYGQAPAVQQEPVAWMHWNSGPVRLFLNKDEAFMELERLNREYPVDAESRKMRPLVFGDTHPAPAEVREPLTDAQIEAGRQRVFSTNNPFCPCDSKTMRKAVQWAERAHGITGSKT